MQSTSCEMPGWMKYKLESRFQGEISIISASADNTTPTAGSEQEVKSLLKVKEKCEKARLKLNIQKTNLMASIPIISWQIDGETMETRTDFIFFSSKFTADGD